MLQASLNTETGKPTYWLHEAVARGDLKVGGSGGWVGWGGSHCNSSPRLVLAAQMALLLQCAQRLLQRTQGHTANLLCVCST